MGSSIQITQNDQISATSAEGEISRLDGSDFVLQLGIGH